MTITITRPRFAALRGMTLLATCLAIMGCRPDVTAPPGVADLDENTTEHAQVHCIGVYSASTRNSAPIDPFGKDIDWIRFARRLIAASKTPQNNPESRLWELLSVKSKEILSNETVVARIHDSAHNRQNTPEFEVIVQRHKVITDLESILRRPDFYHDKSFARVELDAADVELLRKEMELRPLQRLMLNRRLLEAGFPDSVKRSDFRADSLTIPIRVRATKKPLILVLCGYDSVRWAITTDPQAKLESVIVGGYHIQDVTGTTAPVSYHVHYMPNQLGSRYNPDYFYAYEQAREGYSQLATSVRKLTGQDIATFQGRYSYQGGPSFVVPPEK